MKIMRLTTTLAYTLFVAGRPKRGQAAISLATSNCIENNFTDQILYEPTGGQYGICVFTNETACEEGAFLRGGCNVTNPIFAVYCAENGGQISLENDALAEYEVCGQCTEYDYYVLNDCSITSAIDDSNPSVDICAAKGGTRYNMGTIDGTEEYSICSFGMFACELGKLMRGECDETNPNLISFCADNGGEMSLGGVEPLEYEVCSVGELECIEEQYYLYDNCTLTKGGDPNEGPPENDSCSSATVFSTLPSKEVQIGSVAGATEDEFSLDPSCSFLNVPPGKGVWYTIEGVEGGTDLTVVCSKMDCMLLTTNSTLGECPSTFLCPVATVGIGGENNDDLFYDFTTEEGGIYYIYIAPKFEFPGPEYEVTVEETNPPPTSAPTVKLTSAPVNEAAGIYLGALVNVVLFAALYFSSV
jgi:putative hemolysin